MALSAKTTRELSKYLKQRPSPKPKKKAPVLELVTNVDAFTAQHGDYEKQGLRGVINRGGTPIARWSRDGWISETQQAAIDYCIALWERAGRFNGLVMDLNKIVGQPPSSGLAQQEALDELASFRSRIPRRYWDVFENVCRFDSPAGVAGSELATNKRSSIDAARLCVCFVADMIAQWKRF